MSTLQTLAPCDKVPRAALQESLWCLTLSQPQAVLVIRSKHPLPPAVLMTLKTYHLPGCQSFLPLPPPLTLPPTPSPIICQPSAIKFCSNLASLVSIPGLSCGPKTLISDICILTSGLFPLESTRHMASRLVFLFIEYIWKDKQETSNTGFPWGKKLSF